VLFFLSLLLACDLRPLTPGDWPQQADIRALVDCVAPTACPVPIVPADAQLTLGEMIVLDGSLSTAGPDTSHHWQQEANGAPAVTILDADTAIARVVPATPGVYRFRLTVRRLCQEDSAVVTVTVVDDTVVPTTLTLELIADADDIPVGFGSFAPAQVHAHPAEPGVLFIVDLEGYIWIYRNGAIDPTPFLDLSDVLGSCFECVLGSMAFHPDYPQTPLVYTKHTGFDLDGSGNGIDTRVSAFARDPDTLILDRDAGTLVFTVPQTHVNHKGGTVVFGPDGHLFIGLGDGNAQEDPAGNGQNRTTLLGKILRFSVDGQNPLIVPADNPFVDDPTTLDEIWTIGVRNPWRITFDRLSGDMYIGDNGQYEVEEVHAEPAGSEGGKNFGWRIMEGDTCFDPPVDCPTEGLTLPIHTYPHTEGCSVIGGYVYRGSALPNLRGLYLYGDWCSGRISSLRLEDDVWVRRDFQVEGAPDLGGTDLIGFGQDSDGELYVCGKKVYRIIGAQ